MRIVITRGRVIDPASGLDRVTDVCITDNRLTAVGDRPAGFAPDRTIDASGLIVAPGLVDVCARLMEPGSEGALKVEMQAALAGGVTGVVCPPDTDPPLDRCAATPAATTRPVCSVPSLPQRRAPECSG